MASDAETRVGAAYHAAEGNVMDVQGFKELFTEDTSFNPVDAPSERGEYLGDPVLVIAEMISDVHRQLHQVHVIANVVTV